MTTIGPVGPQDPGARGPQDPGTPRFEPFPQSPRAAAPSRRPGDITSYLLGVAGLASVITVLFLTMRTVMGSGGVQGTGGSVAYVIVGGFLFAVLAARGAFRTRAPGVVLISWPVSFLAVAFNFLYFGFDPPSSTGVAGGWIFSGLLFGLLGLIPIVAVVWLRRAVRDAQRNLVTLLRRGGVPKRPGGPSAPPGVRVVDADPPPS